MLIPVIAPTNPYPQTPLPESENSQVGTALRAVRARSGHTELTQSHDQPTRSATRASTSDLTFQRFNDPLQSHLTHQTIQLTHRFEGGRGPGSGVGGQGTGRTQGGTRRGLSRRSLSRGGCD